MGQCIRTAPTRRATPSLHDLRLKSAGVGRVGNANFDAVKRVIPCLDVDGGRVAARIKPNIVFTEDIAGNPRAEIEVRTSPDGTIIGQRIYKSSGVRAWDEAVLKAVIKTEVLPRDVDGRIISPLTIGFRPKD